MSFNPYHYHYELIVGIIMIVLSLLVGLKIYFKGSKSSSAFFVLSFTSLFGLAYVGFYIAWGYVNYTYLLGDVFLIRFASL